MLTAFFVLLTGCIAGKAAQSKSVRIVCIGDSLTSCGGEGGKYTDWLQKYLKNDEIINKGIGGDTLEGGRKRFNKDVIALKPDIVVIALGANDFWKQKRTIEQLNSDLEYMVKAARGAGAEVVIASCFGRRDYNSEEKVEFDAAKFDFGAAIWKMEEKICLKYNCQYVPNMQADIKPNGKAPYWDDTNHPNKAGNELVAKQILPAIKAAKRNLCRK